MKQSKIVAALYRGEDDKKAGKPNIPPRDLKTRQEQEAWKEGWRRELTPKTAT